MVDAIRSACTEGDSMLLQLLLSSKNVSLIHLINKVDENGATPLHSACINKLRHLQIIKLLLESGADVNAKDHRGWTPLLNAIFESTSKSLPIIQLLIKYGANVDFPVKSSGLTPLILASKQLKDAQRIIACLIANGAATHQKDSDGWTYLMHFYYNESTNARFLKFVSKKSGLCQLAFEVVIMKELTENRGNINAITATGGTLLTRASRKGDFHLVKQLVEIYNADINISGQIVGLSDHLSPLSCACIGGHLVIAKYFVSRGAHLIAQSSNELDPVIAASFSGRSDVMHFIFDSKLESIDPFTSESNANYALNVALRFGFQGVIEVLVSQGIRTYRSSIVRAIRGDGGNNVELISYLMASCFESPPVRPSEVLEMFSFDSDWSRCPSVIAFLISGCQKEHLNQFNAAGRTPLIMCCRQSNDAKSIQYGTMSPSVKTLVDLLLANSADPNAPDISEQSPLHYAVRNRLDTGIITALIDYGADVNAVIPDDHSSPLHVACSTSNEEGVNILIKHGAVVNIRNNVGLTPLSIAASIGHVSIVKALLKSNGICVNNVDRTQTSALLHSCKGGFMDAATELLCAGALYNIRNDEGMLPIHYAGIMTRERNNLDLFDGIEDIIDNNCPKHDGRISAATEFARLLLCLGANIHALSGDGSSGLFYACNYGNLPLVKYFLSLSGPLKYSNDNGSSVLHAASMGGHLHVVQYLLECEIVIDIDCTDINGSTSLFKAAEFGHEFVVEYLIKWRANVNKSTNEGLTPLGIACIKNHLQIAERLLVLPLINKYHFDTNGMTVLHLAAASNSRHVVRYLLEHFPVNVVNQDNKTPLYLAICYGHAGMVKLLLACGADPNIICNEGTTPIFEAVDNDDVKMVADLIAAGADVNISVPLYQSFTPLIGAIVSNNIQMVKMLVDASADVLIAGQDGYTVLHAVSDRDICQLLLGIPSIDVDKRDLFGITPLFQSILEEEYDIATLLVIHGADIYAEVSHNEKTESPISLLKHGNEKLAEHRCRLEGIFFWRRRINFLLFLEGCGVETTQYMHMNDGNCMWTFDRSSAQQRMRHSKVLYCPDHFKGIAEYL